MFASAAKPPSAVAHRMRLDRARRRAGLRSLTLEVREAKIDALVRKGLLHRESERDSKAVRTALYTLLDPHLGVGM